MKPPICAVCGKRFDPFDATLTRRGGLVRFADYQPLPDGMTGHPAGTAWLCWRHVSAARALQDRPLASAVRTLRRRRWRMAGWRLVQVLLLLLAGATAWNVIGPLELPDVGDEYVARFHHGRLSDRKTDAEGAALAARWVGTRAVPSWNPFRILGQQLWYNAWTEGYDLVLWVEPRSGDLTRGEFALYQSGRTVFLRIEFEGKNRVLDAEFSAEHLEQALEPYLVGPDALEARPRTQAP